MSEINEKPIEIAQLPGPNLQTLNCPCCKSDKLKISHSRWRTIPDLGTKNLQKFLEFESIHLQCNSCGKIFPFQRAGIVPGLSVSGDVLDTVLTLYFDFGNSGDMVRRLMEKLYSVMLKRETILSWIRKYGKDYCKKNDRTFKENIELNSGVLALDGTFPALALEEDDGTKIPHVKKKQVSCLRLTTLSDGTLLAIWDEAKTNPKSPNF
ncbi:hypothetical protein KJA13_03135 [Patescibacteria group bacterium]|nr:hypothetical protein [Patescibacteria group bacterium]